jgi:hypothetical protein
MKPHLQTARPSRMPKDHHVCACGLPCFPNDNRDQCRCRIFHCGRRASVYDLFLRCLLSGARSEHATTSLSKLDEYDSCEQTKLFSPTWLNFELVPDLIMHRPTERDGQQQYTSESSFSKAWHFISSVLQREKGQEQCISRFKLYCLAWLTRLTMQVLRVNITLAFT